MATMAGSPSVSIGTVLTRPTVIIDGVSYELRHPEELSVLQFHEIARNGRRIDALFEQDELSAEDQRKLANILEATVRAELIAGDDVLAKLSPVHRLRIIRSYAALQRLALQSLGATLPTVPQHDPGADEVNQS